MPNLIVTGGGGASGGGDVPNYAGRLTVKVSTQDSLSHGSTKVVVRNEALGAYYVQPLDALGATTFELLENYTYHLYLIDYPTRYYGGAAVVTVGSKDEITENILLKTSPDVVGFYINETTGTISYTDGAVNFIPATMNLSTGVFNWGSWENFWLFRQKPCMLKNGVVQYYLNPNDYTKKVDGTPSKLAPDEYGLDDGDVMIEFPMSYYNIYSDANGWGCRFSLVPQGEDWQPIAFLNRSGIPQNTMYMSAYEGFTDNGKLRSWSGKAPTANQTIGVFRTQATANGLGYEQQEWHKRSYVIMLLFLISRAIDSQATFGRGRVDGQSTALPTGTMDKKGMFWGDSGGVNGVKVFGMEHFWGNIRHWCDGLGAISSTYRVKAYAPYNDAMTGYTAMGSVPATNYINRIAGPTNARGTLPTAAASTEAASLYKDQIYLGSGTFLANTGGHWNNGSSAGALYLGLDCSASYAVAGVAAALSFTPV